MSGPQHNVAASVCDHAYEVRLLGGHPLSVRLCTLCRTPDWADLYEQADSLFRWGREEGLAGKPPRAKLSAYDRPRKGGPVPGEETHQGPGVYGGLETHRGDRHACPAPDCGPQGVRILSNDPEEDDGVHIHFPEVDYVDTQVWSADIGISADVLRELRDAITRHLDKDGAGSRV